MNLEDYIVIPEELRESIHRTGSSVICNPPVVDTDIDYLILTKKLGKLHDFLLENDFKRSEVDSEEYDLSVEGGFNCYRRNNINIIVTSCSLFFTRWVRATTLAKKFNLLKKGDRIALFKAILYPIEYDFEYRCKKS